MNNRLRDQIFNIESNKRPATKKTIFVLSLLGLILSCSYMAQPGIAAKETETKKKRKIENQYDWGNVAWKPQAKRLIDFPKDKSIGGLASFKKPCFNHDEKLGRSLKAQGTVEIAPGEFVFYFPNHNFFLNPSLVNNLPANAFDGIVMRYASMADEDEGRSAKAMPYLARFTSVAVMDLEKSEMSDTGLRALKSMKNLQYLGLFANELDGSFLKDLTELKMLRIIILSNNTLKEENLQYIPLYKGLKVLNLAHTRVSTKALKFLAQAPSLEILSLSGNDDVKDDLIPLVLPLKNLGLLDIRRAGVTQAGFDKIRQARPDLTIMTYLNRKPGKPNEEKGSKTKEYETIFGPLSRDRKL